MCEHGAGRLMSLSACVVNSVCSKAITGYWLEQQHPVWGISLLPPQILQSAIKKIYWKIIKLDKKNLFFLTKQNTHNTVVSMHDRRGFDKSQEIYPHAACFYLLPFVPQWNFIECQWQDTCRTCGRRHGHRSWCSKRQLQHEFCVAMFETVDTV